MKRLKTTCKLYGMLYRRSTLRLYAALIFLFALAACDADLITEQGGLLPDEAAMGTIGSKLQSNLSFSGNSAIELTIGIGEEEIVADKLYY